MTQRILESPNIQVSIYVVQTEKNYLIQTKLDMTFKEIISQLIFADCLPMKPVESYGLLNVQKQTFYKADQLNLRFWDIFSIETLSKFELQILRVEEFLKQEPLLQTQIQLQPNILLYEPNFDNTFQVSRQLYNQMIDIKIQYFDGIYLSQFSIKIKQDELLQTLVDRIYQTLGLSKEVSEIKLYFQNKFIFLGNQLCRRLYELSLQDGSELIVKMAWTGGLTIIQYY